MTFMMDYMETCPGHVATVQHHAPAVQAPRAMIMSCHELQQICLWSGDMIELLTNIQEIYKYTCNDCNYVSDG